MLYRVLVSAKRDHWQYIEVEADDVEMAEKLACEKFKLEGSLSSDTYDLVVEGVEILDSRPSKTSEEVWNLKERNAHGK